MDTNYINIHFCHIYAGKVHDDMTLMSDICSLLHIVRIATGDTSRLDYSRYFTWPYSCI